MWDLGGRGFLGVPAGFAEAEKQFLLLSAEDGAGAGFRDTFAAANGLTRMG